MNTLVLFVSILFLYAIALFVYSLLRRNIATFFSDFITGGFGAIGVFASGSAIARILQSNGRPIQVSGNDTYYYALAIFLSLTIAAYGASKPFLPKDNKWR
jgi:hypothetical protein